MKPTSEPHPGAAGTGSNPIQAGKGEAGALTRRRLLGLAGTLGFGAFAGYGTREVGAWPVLSCVARPEQTEGPYFVDDRLERSDIRVDPSDGAVSGGVPVRLRLVVHRLDGGACAPLPGATVDLWQCDAAGVYSDVLDQQGRFDTRGRAFLRGYQRTGADGSAEFTTIYPGWYAGRTPHLHFKVRTFDGERRTHAFTSQLYFDDALTDRVYEREPYRASGTRDRRNEQDGIFRGGGTGAQLMLDLTPDGEGFAGTFELGLMMG